MGSLACFVPGAMPEGVARALADHGTKRDD